MADDLLQGTLDRYFKESGVITALVSRQFRRVVQGEVVTNIGHLRDQRTWEWALSMELTHEEGIWNIRDPLKSDCSRLADLGLLPVLKWVHSSGGEIAPELLWTAARKGGLDVLRWMSSIAQDHTGYAPKQLRDNWMS
jgi:hypothetical protein